MVKIIISGIAGRMGQIIASLAVEDSRFYIVYGLEEKDLGETVVNKKIIKVGTDLNKMPSTDVLIEFTTPKATMEHLAIAVKKKIAMVIGTTGFNTDEVKKIEDASKEIAIVYSPNMSVGANLLFRLSEEVARALGSEYEIEIVEAHHSKKKDAPSGTAKRLGESVAKVTGKVPSIHSIRVGDIVGEHTVIFAGKSERIELMHKAHSRTAFAMGALDSARFVAGKKTGLYSMEDVIGSS